jgi:hypothetical protein
MQQTEHFQDEQTPCAKLAHGVARLRRPAELVERLHPPQPAEVHERPTLPAPAMSSDGTRYQPTFQHTDHAFSACSVLQSGRQGFSIALKGSLKDM